MGRKLFIANTYYQLILAIQMRDTIFPEDETVLFFSDHSNNSLETVKTLQQLGIFSECYHIRTKNMYINRKRFQSIEEIFSMTFLKKNVYSSFWPELKNCWFDEIIVFTFDIAVDGLYYYLSTFNRELKVSRYEEGIFSYSSGDIFYKKRYLISGIRRIIRRPAILENFKNFYCYYPDLYDGKLTTAAVPVIKKDSKVSLWLTELFPIKLTYSQKYIFFTSVFDFEGGTPIGEYELVCKIRDFVGNDNLLIKLHPRDFRSIYRDNGFNVDENSAAPWEAIQLSHDFGDKVFLTVNSGSVVSGNMMSEHPAQTYYLYKLCNVDGNTSYKKATEDIAHVLNDEHIQKALKTVHIVNKLEEIL